MTVKNDEDPTPEEIAGRLALLHANGTSWVKVLAIHRGLILEGLGRCGCEDCSSGCG